jgi:hypothetical protein
MPCTRSASANRIGPLPFEFRCECAIVDQCASDASILPAAWRASSRTSMQPPAAAAVRCVGRFAQAKDRAFEKNTKAGTSARSAKLTHRNFAINELSTRPSACALATRRACR